MIPTMINKDLTTFTKSIEKWIKDYFAINNKKGAVVGLSGGIDSAVVATLCRNALGKHNVIGVMLPCESNKDDFDFAMKLANKINIDWFIVSLDKQYKECLKTQNDLRKLIGYDNVTLKQGGNIKARLRMKELYAIAEFLDGYLVANTCNYSETIIGYDTKFGDSAGDFSPLQNIYKTDVYKIAKELNLHNLVPEIFNRKPTPGLEPNQTDEQDLGFTYEYLDNYLKCKELEDFNINNFDIAIINKIERLIKISEHKRITMPSFK